MKLVALLVAPLVLAASLAAAPLRVLAMHSVMAEFAREVGGAEVTVASLVPAGVDPHTFNPAPADVRELAGADLVLATGFGFEPWLEKLIAQSGTRARVFRASDVVTALKTLEAHGDHHHEGEADPHWWHSPRAAGQAVAGITAALSRERPGAAQGFRERGEALELRMAGLGEWAAAELARVAPQRRQLVTSHEAFGYLARDFGIRVHSLHGLNPEAEPDARSLAAMIRLIRAEGIRVVFADNTENSRLFDSMLRESGARLGPTLYADGLGPAGSPADTYERMFRHNLAAILAGMKAE